MGRFAAESEMMFTIDESERNLESYICIPTIAAISKIYSKLLIKNSFIARRFSSGELSLKAINLFLGFQRISPDPDLLILSSN
jgi:hypothetical protein